MKKFRKVSVWVAGAAAFVLIGGALSPNAGAPVSDMQASQLSGGGCTGYSTPNCSGCAGTYYGTGSTATDSESVKGSKTCCDTSGYSGTKVCT